MDTIGGQPGRDHGDKPLRHPKAGAAEAILQQESVFRQLHLADDGNQGVVLIRAGNIHTEGTVFVADHLAAILPSGQLPPPVEGRSRLLQPRPLCAALLVFQAMHLLTYLLYLLHLPMIPGLDYTQPLPALMTIMLRVTFVLNDLVFWWRPFLVLLFLFVLLTDLLSQYAAKER